MAFHKQIVKDDTHILHVRVTPASRRDLIKETKPNVFEVITKESATGNRANIRVREMLSEHFEVPVARVRIISGARARKKVIQIT